MTRPTGALLDSSRYAARYTIWTRYADMDPNRHINNVAMAAMFEDARVRFDLRLNLDRLAAHGRMMVAAAHVDYLAEAHYPQPLEIAMAVEAIGRTSWTVAQLALQNELPCAFCRAVIVLTDDTGSVAMPQWQRDQLSAALLRMD